MFASDLSSVSHKISDFIRSKFDHPYPTSKKTTLTARDVWFAEFRKKYRWDESIEDSVRAAFEKVAQTHMKDLLGDARKDFKKKGRPHWIGEVV
ncbi:hypothetical protein Dimus_020717 [Dionaea muscipula]